ncbi:MAG: response regulator [Bacteroidales bacterium]|nr:response regulator [Bacteroidales bacterium]
MGNKNILIIEDEADMIHRLITELKKHYKVEIAGSVSAAKYLLNESGISFDLIFLDSIMPNYPYSVEETNGGLETGWVLYEKELRDKRIPIVVWTRHTAIFTKPWGGNVHYKEKKDGTNDNQLVDLAKKNIKL